MFDLHIHTTCSDGSDTVDEVIDKIHSAGIDYFSITDHDTALSARTILSSDELKNKIRNYGLTYVTGTEWTCEFMGRSVHILSYDFDPFADEVLALENEIKQLLIEKNEFRSSELNKKGLILSEKSLNYLNSRINIRKLDIANCLVDDGYFSNLQDAVDCFNDIHYPKKYRLNGEKVISTLSKIGAKVVWAHSIYGLGQKPISFEQIDLFAGKMKKLGMSGIETYYSLYNREQINELIKIAKKHNLFLTSGSDYHGKNKTVKLAEISIDKTMYNKNEIIVDKIFKNVIIN